MAEDHEPVEEGSLSEVVEETRGIQPWRRAFHATNGTLLVLALGVFGLEVSLALPILGGILVFMLVLDGLRLLDPKVNVLFFRAFASLASPREATKIASSTWYAISAFLVLLLFPKAYALAGILVLAWGDPAANLVGRRWGRIPFLAGTVLGTATFLLVAFLALVLFVPWWIALVTAAVTAVVEAAAVDLDDNLIVPLTAAVVLFLIAG